MLTEVSAVHTGPGMKGGGALQRNEPAFVVQFALQSC
jgi:hypothetical protein